MSRVESWNPIIERFQNRLSKWKAKALSIGGRRVLVQAVLGSIPTYYLSIFKAPKSVIDALERLRRDFFWGSDADNRKKAWVKWSTVIRDKESGGLGIGSIFASNISLLVKWVWKFKNDPNAPWVKFIKSIYGENGGLTVDQGASSCGSPWGSIVSAVKTLRLVNINWEDLCTKKVGNGLKTAFWTDRWKGAYSFSNRFPRLYALETDKHASVANRVKDGSSWSWRRPIRDGREVEEFDQLREVIGDYSLTDKPDRWNWELSSNGFFSATSMRSFVEKVFLGAGDKETIWNSLVPSRVNIFIWRVMMDRLPTRDNLIKLKVDLDSALCPVCGSDNESIQHMLFKCPIASEVWRFIERWWSFSIPGNRSLESMINGIKAAFNNRLDRKVLEAVFFTTCYILWCFRNKCVFDILPPRKAAILDFIVEKSYCWVLARCKGSVKNPVVWSCNPTSCIKNL